MRKNQTGFLAFVGVLVVLTCVAMAYADRAGRSVSESSDPAIDPVFAAEGPVAISGRLTGDKVFSGGDGDVSLCLDLRAQDAVGEGDEGVRNVDLVIVVDRSGSMHGRKLEDARRAVLELLARMSEKDRFALVSYADSVEVHSSLLKMTSGNRRRFQSLASGIRAGGGTNLGEGLQAGIDLLSQRENPANPGKVILISDGIANQGITAPSALGQMASIAVEKYFSVSTVGVGADFNEQLMTCIADRGAGNYHYLENPAAFAAVFQREFHNATTVAASSVKVVVPLPDGVTLVDASGYPIRLEGRAAVIFPGDLSAGRTRKLFLTFKVSTGEKRSFEIAGVSAEYRHRDRQYRAVLPDAFQIACVENRADALASIDRKEWEEKVLSNDFNRLKEQVALDIKKGDRQQALEKIEAYRAEKEAVNQTVQSSGVASNLANEVGKLREIVAETFAGPADEVDHKQKRNAKSLQYEGYSGRRANK